MEEREEQEDGEEKQKEEQEEQGERAERGGGTGEGAKVRAGGQALAEGCKGLFGGCVGGGQLEKQSPAQPGEEPKAAAEEEALALREGPTGRHRSSKSQQETVEAVPRLIPQLCTRLALVPVAQAGKPVLDDLIAVLPTLGQVDHLAGGDQGPDLILGHGDQAWHVWAGGARQDHTGCVTTGLQQDRTKGDDVVGDVDQGQQDTGQGGVEHVQAVSGLCRLRLVGANRLVKAPEEEDRSVVCSHQAGRVRVSGGAGKQVAPQDSSRTEVQKQDLSVTVGAILKDHCPGVWFVAAEDGSPKDLSDVDSPLEFQLRPTQQHTCLRAHDEQIFIGQAWCLHQVADGPSTAQRLGTGVEHGLPLWVPP